MATRVVTVNDILDGHVGLDLECFDRIYLNGWVPNLQVSGQVVNFLTHHLGFPIPSPAILEKIGLQLAALAVKSGNEFGVLQLTAVDPVPVPAELRRADGRSLVPQPTRRTTTRALHPYHHRRRRPGRRSGARCRPRCRQILGTPSHPAPYRGHPTPAQRRGHRDSRRHHGSRSHRHGSALHSLARAIENTLITDE